MERKAGNEFDIDAEFLNTLDICYYQNILTVHCGKTLHSLLNHDLSCVYFGERLKLKPCFIIFEKKKVSIQPKSTRRENIEKPERSRKKIEEGGDTAAADFPRMLHDVRAKILEPVARQVPITIRDFKRIHFLQPFSSNISAKFSRNPNTLTQPRLKYGILVIIRIDISLKFAKFKRSRTLSKCLLPHTKIGKLALHLPRNRTAVLKNAKQ